MSSVLGRYFVVRHKPTGACLPARMHNPAQHWTHWEPSKAPDRALAPRMFTRQVAARSALTNWLQGAWVAELSPTAHSDPEVVGIAAEPRPERVAEDMEVIPVQVLA